MDIKKFFTQEELQNIKTICKIFNAQSIFIERNDGEKIIFKFKKKANNDEKKND